MAFGNSRKLGRSELPACTKPIDGPSQLRAGFRLFEEEDVEIGDACHTPERHTYLSMASITCFAMVEWTLRESTISQEPAGGSTAIFRGRLLGQDWLRDPDGQNNPRVDHEWVNEYKELLRYVVKLLTSATPSSFRTFRRTSGVHGFDIPAPPARRPRAPRNFVWSSVTVSPRAKKSRNAPADRSSSPLDASDILQRWFAVLASVDDGEEVQTVRLQELVEEYGGSVKDTLATLNADLEAAFWNTFIERGLDIDHLLLHGVEQNRASHASN
ncbi:unnamed protein product [Sympodiomycopsis kandeliae]